MTVDFPYRETRRCNQLQNPCFKHDAGSPVAQPHKLVVPTASLISPSGSETNHA
jgi:hypothetical protein